MKNVVITGSSSGFGLLAAKKFARNGYKVWAAMRHADSTNTGPRKELESASQNIHVISMDVTEETSVTTSIDRVIAEDGKVDVLINNAGIMYIGLTEAYSIAQAHAQMETNYYGTIRCMQAVLPTMRAAGSGLIINCSSIAGRLAVPFFGTYCATKHALEAYSQSLHYELAPFGIEVVLVEPGPFGTNLLSSAKSPDRQDVLTSYRQLGSLPTTMIEGFAAMLASEGAPDPQIVADTYLALSETPAGQRPVRTVVGITWSADEMNALTQPIQDRILQEMQLENVLRSSH